MFQFIGAVRLPAKFKPSQFLFFSAPSLRNSEDMQLSIFQKQQRQNRQQADRMSTGRICPSHHPSRRLPELLTIDTIPILNFPVLGCKPSNVLSIGRSEIRNPGRFRIERRKQNVVRDLVRGRLSRGQLRFILRASSGVLQHVALRVQWTSICCKPCGDAFSITIAPPHHLQGEQSVWRLRRRALLPSSRIQK